MRILLCEKHPMSRLGLATTLRTHVPGCEVIEGPPTVKDGDPETIWSDLYGPLDLIFCDPSPSTPRALRLSDLEPYLARAAGTPLIVFAGSEFVVDIKLCLDQQVMGYVPKTTQPDVLAQIISLVLAGAVYVPACITTARSDADQTALLSYPLPDDYTPHLPLNDGANGAPAIIGRPTRPASKAIPPALENLTRRQWQVLELLANGSSNAEIATRLKLNLSTIKSHVTAVFRALNVRNRTQAVLVYRKECPDHLRPEIPS